MMGNKSEYQGKFGRKREVEQECYEEMVNFRRRKKSSEYRHTPIIWHDPENEESESVENETFTKLNSDSVSCLPLSPAPCSKAIQTSKIVLTKDVAVQSPERRRSLRQISKRKLESPESLKKKNISAVNHEKPIIAYGWADKTSVWKKRTYNVKAPTRYVRPSALRAERQREKNMKLKLTKKEKLANEKLKNQVLLDSLTNFNQWQTEYQKQFCT